AIAFALPDLGLSAQAVEIEPAMPVPGLPMRVRATLGNRGAQPAGPVRVHLYEIRNGEAFGVASPIELPALAPSAVFDAQWEWQVAGEGVDALLIQLDPERAAVDGD